VRFLAKVTIPTEKGDDAFTSGALPRTTTIEWSYELLSEAEKTLFARLSVFSGGSTLEAAEEVAEADLDSLQSLVEKSLLRFTNERYWMLETIREFAGERLEATGEAADVLLRHAHHFRALAEAKAARDVIDLYVDELDLEHDNLRTALGTLLESAASGVRHRRSLDSATL